MISSSSVIVAWVYRRRTRNLSQICQADRARFGCDLFRRGGGDVPGPLGAKTLKTRTARL